ncbi:hypothetical protein [Sphingomonas koreensis]
MLLTGFMLAAMPPPLEQERIASVRCRIIEIRLAELTALGRSVLKRRSAIAGAEDKPQIDALGTTLDENEALITEAEKHFGTITPVKADFDAYEGLAMPALRAELRRCIDQHRE